MRYASDAKMDEAVVEYRKLKQLSKDKAERYNDNLLLVLFHTHKWDEVLQTINSLSPDATRQALALAAIAARDGSQSALSEAERRDPNQTSRSETLVSAANFLVQLRRYPAAVDLLGAAASGQNDASQLRSRIEVLRNARSFEEILLPENDPRRTVQNYYLFLLDPLAGQADLHRLIVVDPQDEKEEFEQASQRAHLLRETMTRGGSALPVARDVILSTLRMAVEGDESSGYRIRLNGAGDGSESILIAKHDGRYVIVAIGSSVAMVGNEVLRRLGTDDLKGAKLWLDWTRQQVTANSGDDPLGGSAFARFWARGDEPDGARMRMAAFSLLSMCSAIRQYLPQLKAARDAAPDNTTADKIDLLLARSAIQLKDWNLYREVAPRLLAANPSSDRALNFVVNAAIYTRDWSMAQKAIADRLSRLPDDSTAVRSSAWLVEAQGDFAEARKLIRPLIDSNRATVNDINQYTWDSLFLSHVTNEDVSLLQRALTGNNGSFAAIHTLACLYADMGKTKEARELLLQTMDVRVDQPNDAIWFGFGRIAEQYGLNDVALSFYQKVGDTPPSRPGSPFNLAQLREKLIRSTASPVTTSGNN